MDWAAHLQPRRLCAILTPRIARASKSEAWHLVSSTALYSLESQLDLVSLRLSSTTRELCPCFILHWHYMLCSACRSSSSFLNPCLRIGSSLLAKNTG